MTRVGIIGAGQLGQMLGQAGRKIGAECSFLDPAPCPPASTVGPVISLPFDSADGLAQLASGADVITYEFENVPLRALDVIPVEVPVYPPARALEYSQDRLAEKTLFSTLGIPLAEYRAVDCEEDLRNAVEEIGLPLVLKTRRLGYDGKGQCIVRTLDDISGAIPRLGEVALIAEQWVGFEREVSAIGVRGRDGEISYYPLTENRHEDGILRVSRAPAQLRGLDTLANQYLRKLLLHLDYVGVLALELFVSGETLLANEFAPRVHNSGHWTIEGATTSQFENHLRAICGLPLGETSVRGYAGMVNLIGSMPAGVAAIDRVEGHLHDYGKEARPGRKLGHITVISDNLQNRDRRLVDLQSSLPDC